VLARGYSASIKRGICVVTSEIGLCAVYRDSQDGVHIAVEFSETINTGIMENARS